MTHPTIQPTQKLLASSFQHGDYVLDLYGYVSRCEEINVEDVTLAGDKRSLVEFFTAKQLDSMSYALERKAEREAQAARVERGFELFSARMMGCAVLG